MGRKSIATTRRKEIIVVYHQLILEEGFEQASTTRLAQRMDMKSSLLMYYFSTKEELVMGLIDFIIEEYEQQFLPGLDEIVEPVERIRYLLDTLFSRNWDELGGEKVFYSIYPLIFRKPEIRKRFREMFLGLRNVLIVELMKANEAQVIHVSEPQVLANLIISMLEGINFYENIIDDPDMEAEQFQLMKEIIWQRILPKAD